VPRHLLEKEQEVIMVVLWKLKYVLTYTIAHRKVESEREIGREWIKGEIFA